MLWCSSLTSCRKSSCRLLLVSLCTTLLPQSSLEEFAVSTHCRVLLVLVIPSVAHQQLSAVHALRDSRSRRAMRWR